MRAAKHVSRDEDNGPADIQWLNLLAKMAIWIKWDEEEMKYDDDGVALDAMTFPIGFLDKCATEYLNPPVST